MQTPKDFCARAHCEDASIDAIKHNDLPWEGWMWHPEREKSFDLNNGQIISSLFK